MRKLLLTLITLTISLSAYPQSDGKKHLEGYISVHTHEEKGKIFLEISDLDKEFLYVNALVAGVGSNDLGLDRGQLGNTRVVEFRKAGNKILLVEKNMNYRAISDNEDEVRSVQDAFAESVLWGFEITESKGGKHMVDATSFYLQDAHQIAEKLTKAKQGSYKLEASRSAIHYPMTKNFPKNTEVEAIITVVGSPTGRHISSVTPSAESVTVRQRHSFIELPDDNYKPRAFDPRAGYFSISYMDYATPISEPIMKRFISRHRLEKKNPELELSEAVKPIIYYLDRGTPEPIRSALIEGGNWWKDAFESAGYKNAFRVELLPEGSDPMDVRYNVIQWVHRSTRGWSYGASVRDPRTGEIIKGHVSLGSLRVRQDYLIAQGLLQPYGEGKEYDSTMLKMSLDRLRQLSAHEIGHTIGLAHNYSASPNMSSVMDYPYPNIQLTAKGDIDLSNAYDQHIGEWDKWAIKYGYVHFENEQDEKIGLKKILEETYDEGFEFISDRDARSPGGSHPRAHLWDNHALPQQELLRLLKIRNSRLKTFGMNAIPEGTPLATLEEVLVPLYLMHRYQLEATSKLIGGVDYRYKIKGDNQAEQQTVSAEQQKQALDAILTSIQPIHLELPSDISALIHPRPLGYNAQETFSSRNGLNFDPLAPAENLVNMTLDLLFEPSRVNRLHQQALLDKALPSYNWMLEELISKISKTDNKAGWHQEIQMMSERILIEKMISLSKNPDVSSTVRALTRSKLQNIYTPLSDKANINRSIVHRKDKTPDSVRASHDNYLANRIHTFLSLPETLEPIKTLEIPDGAPIGSRELIYCEH
ncbi:zinc-dependent metalloprotease [Anditalea andensis]|uniref:Peptidase n=1 Tax=Anditalea andensis TaxID=1048983 RepID=A0A074KVR0_9BACT|nr:zinc-dependent metalloprotease [Anditalea andensis]KEO72350.1 peptidase [Anditalea andensis]